ncbi:MAG: glycosyltransferase family 4 protein [Candidatus Moranbacteria bacterium]|nr:glycosyltransferase family 4 protein [Candidatus Moranbacteria bacterium]
MKIALVHDYLVQYGGAEGVLQAFREVYPEAPIYTLIHDRESVHGLFDDARIHTSFLQRIPGVRRAHRIFPLLMPGAIEEFDLSGYDVVLSDSASFAKGVLTGPDTLHISYIHTPMRYAWDDCQKYTEDFGFPRMIRRIVPFFMNPLRLWDRASADRPDLILANSGFVARRIRKYYGREARVIPPPVDTRRFHVSDTRGDYFLMVGRLIAYKRFDIAVEAFTRLGIPLKIAGRGPELKRLKKMAGPNIEFLGRVPDGELSRHYAECRAFIFPQEEDFGIVAMEALASGRPVIAYRGGDIEERIEEGVSGMFFDEQTPEAVMEAVSRFDDSGFDPERIREKAIPFDKEVFMTTIREYVGTALADKRMTDSGRQITDNG